MASNSPLTGAQLIQLASDFNDLGDELRDILTDPSIALNPDQSNVLSADMTQMYNIAGNLATWGARVIFTDSDNAFQTILSSTESGKVKLAKIKADAAKLNSVLKIAAAAVSLGIAFGTGNWVSVISAAGNLGTAVAQA